MSSNLLNETLEALREGNYQTSDITFIGSMYGGYQCTWEEFKRLADFEYGDSGCFVFPQIAEDLIIVLKDGSRLVREFYEGFECWELIRVFTFPVKSFPITSLRTNVGHGNYYVTLEDIHKQ